MSDRKGRERELPAGYQFGDARNVMMLSLGEYERIYAEACVRIGYNPPIEFPSEEANIHAQVSARRHV